MPQANEIKLRLILGFYSGTNLQILKPSIFEDLAFRLAYNSTHTSMQHGIPPKWWHLLLLTALIKSALMEPVNESQYCAYATFVSCCDRSASVFFY